LIDRTCHADRIIKKTDTIISTKFGFCGFEFICF